MSRVRETSNRVVRFSKNGVRALRHPREFLHFLARQLADYELGRAAGQRGAEGIADWLLDQRLQTFMTSPPTRLLPAVDLDHFCGSSPSIDTLEHEQPDESELPRAEREALRRLVHWLSPRSVFEIGTYRGRTTRLLAASAPEAIVHTLDLPPARMREGGCFRTINARLIGAWFNAEPSLQSRVVQHFGDSREFDFSRFYGHIDLVFVDGSHAYETVLGDSWQALRMISGSGMVVWDDYHPIHGPGVMRALSEFDLPEQIFWISGTRLALYRRHTQAAQGLFPEGTGLSAGFTSRRPA